MAKFLEKVEQCGEVAAASLHDYVLLDSKKNLTTLVFRLGLWALDHIF